MEWSPSPDWLIEAFSTLVPDDPRVERRKMFGYPCAFACDNMFIGLHRNNMVMRLPDGERERFLAEERSEIFSPFPGRLMREYVVVPHALILERKKALQGWIARSLDYAASVKPRAKKAKAAPPLAPAKRAATDKSSEKATSAKAATQKTATKKSAATKSALSKKG